MIDETRRHRADAQWWKDHRAKGDDELSKAESAFALWAIADGGVLDELLSEFGFLVADLPENRYRALLLASARLARADYLTGRQVSAAAENVRVAELLRVRNLRATEAAPTPREALEEAPETALAAVARESGWLKVDRIAAYR